MKRELDIEAAEFVLGTLPADERAGGGKDTAMTHPGTLPVLDVSPLVNGEAPKVAMSTAALYPTILPATRRATASVASVTRAAAPAAATRSA